jgi:transposase
MNPRYLRLSFNTPRVFLYRDAVDFRKQINGLAAIVALELGHNPFDEGL